MKFKFPLQIRIILFLLFIILMVLSNQLFVPHLAIFGIIFTNGNIALFITIIAIIIMIASMAGIVKRHKYSFYALSLLLSIMVFNSFLNVMSSIFLRDDVNAFITRVFGSTEYMTGFLINQLLLFGLGFVALKLLFNKKNWFRNL